MTRSRLTIVFLFLVFAFILCTMANAQTGKFADDTPVDVITSLAEKGDLEAQYELGRLYRHGLRGIKKDDALASKWTQEAAKKADGGFFSKGDPLGMFARGLCYEEGYGVQKNPQEAVKWYQKSAEQGNTQAMYYFALALLNGDGIKKNKKEAIKWLQKSAELGLAPAQFSIGQIYFDSDNAECKREGIKWFCKSAEQGDVNAMFMIGIMYADGVNETIPGIFWNTEKPIIEPDMHEAVKWWRQAAEKGHIEAAGGYAACLYFGEGIVEDQKKGMELLHIAADSGSKIATNVLNEIKAQERKDTNFESDANKKLVEQRVKQEEWNTTQKAALTVTALGGVALTGIKIIEWFNSGE